MLSQVLSLLALLMIDAAMGFCIYNNVGVAARWALQKFPHRVQRILIIDWDVQYFVTLSD